MRNFVLLGCVLVSFSGCVGLPPTDLNVEELRELEDNGSEGEVNLPPPIIDIRNLEGEVDVPPDLLFCDCRFVVEETMDGLVCFGMRCSDGCPPETTRCAEAIGGCTIRR